ncbi:MAG: hypothetical protein ABW199_01075 [Caulobacterales bacterium]
MRDILSAAAIFALCVTPAMAQPRTGGTNYRTQVQNYLGEQAGKHTADGFRQEQGARDFVRQLRLDGGALWPLQLQAGVTYRVFAVCDNDCSDVDLEVYDPSGAFVGRDISTTDIPYVEVTPTAAGQYMARIWLAACESEPCYVAARLYRR